MASRFLVPFGGRPSMMRGDPFLQLHREMNRLFDDTFRGFGGGEGGQGGGTIMPSLDVHDIDDGIEVTAELPGVAKDDIDLSLDGDMLTISGEKKNERKDERAHVVERSYGSFRRSVQLPFAPDPGKVQADCDNGILRIRLPRGAEQERSKKIPIGGTMDQQAQGGTENRSAIGQNWSGGEKKDDLAGQQTGQDRNAPA